ncbi:helix-turn-helix transcriptional regulator [Glutamicibacter sp.]|uniref:helix-turn-helix transcriptional regulator n=2 Tax=Glutamicibacter sp. TaxID=1931995 RepID=UPI002D028C37|nr:AAA family ATPase [Glutamicibacter sp.]
MDIHGEIRACLDAAMDHVGTGTGTTFLIHGEGGIGKTRLLRSLIARADHAGWRTMYAAAHDYDQDIAYATLRNVAATVENSELPADVRGISEQLQLALDDLAMTSTDEVTSTQLRSPPLTLFTRLVRSLSFAAPVLLVIDDAHLSDEDSLVALTLAARHLVGRKLMLVFASRTSPWSTGQALHATIGHLVSEHEGTVLELHPAAGESLAALAATILGAQPEARLCGYLAERTRGNALLVQETLRALQGAGAVRIEQSTAYLVDDSPPMFSRREALLRRVFSSTDTELEVARHIAVCGRVDLDYLPLLAQLTGFSSRRVASSFDALVGTGALSETTGGWYEFSHPLIGELLYEGIGPANRRTIHAAIAQHTSVGAPRLRMTQLERDRHLVEGAARGDATAISTALRTADQVLRTSPLSAARWYERSLALIPPGSQQIGEALSRQSIAYWKGSRPTQAIIAGQRALDVLQPGRSLDRTVATMVNCFNSMGKLRQADDLLVQQLPHVLNPAAYLAQRAAMLARLGENEQARSLMAQAWEQVSSCPPADQVIAYTYLGQAECSVGTFDKLGTAVSSLEELGHNDLELPSGARTSAFESAAHNAALASDTANSIRLLKLSQKPSLLAGFEDIGGQAGLARCLALFQQGQWTQAMHTIAQEAVHLEFSGLRSNLARLRTVEVQILLGRAEFARAQEVLERNKSHVVGTSEFALWQSAAAGLDVAMARTQQAIPVLEQQLEHAQKHGWNEVISLASASLIEAYLASSMKGQARKLAEELSAHAQHTKMPRDLGLASVSGALCRLELDEAEILVNRAKTQGDEFLAAQGQYALALAGREVQENLSSAWKKFNNMEAALWLKRVEAAARDHGILIARTSSRRAEIGTLTAVERQLVTMLAEGLSNKQLAEILSYSNKTIEAYLTKLYRKSGYPSRVELIVAYERGDLQMS